MDVVVTVTGTQAVYGPTGSPARYVAGGLNPATEIGLGAIKGVGAPVAAGLKDMSYDALFVGVTAFDAAGGGFVEGVAAITAVGMLTASATTEKAQTAQVNGVGLVEATYSTDRTDTFSVIGIGAPAAAGGAGTDFASGDAIFIGIGAPAGTGTKETSSTATFVGIGNPTGSGVAQLDVSGTAQIIGIGAPAATGAAATPTDTGFVICGTGASEDTGSASAWSNPTRITASDNSRARSSNASGVTSDTLVASNFGFSIPGTATIVGVEVRAELSKTAFLDASTYSYVNIGKDSSTLGTSKAPGDSITTSDVNYDDGGSSDMWGLSLTPTEVNASTFQARIRVDHSYAFGTSEVDCDAISVKIYYTT